MREPSPVGIWLATSLQLLQPRSAASGRLLLLSLFFGALADFTLSNGLPGIGLTIFSIAASGIVIGAGWRRSLQAVSLGVTAAALSVIFSVLSSPWVNALALIGVTAALLTGASLVRGGDLYDLSWAAAALRTVDGAGHALLTVPWLGSGIAHVSRRLSGPRNQPLLRGALLAAPLVILLGALLAAADPLFSSLFALSLDTNGLIRTVLFLIAGTLSGAVLLRIAMARETPDPAPVEVPALGMTEALTILTSIAALFAAFTATQIASALGAGRELLAQRGLTYSQYARAGYFQMLAVVVITVVLLPVFKQTAMWHETKSRFVRALSGLVVLLTLGIGGVALRRLSLYDDAYGLTMLRFSSISSAIWLGVLLLLLGASLMGLGRAKAWFPGAALTSLLLFAGAFATINPEAYVARFNLVHVQSVPLDTAYLSSLSDDAVPSLVQISGARGMRSVLCSRATGGPWHMWSLSRSAADDALHRICS